ncbi:hypothetical protein [Acinetobacter ursingii]|jgi:hypothetical protein|uniref:Uncharacterized protein n=1 Tax=Acinetobacter ursingii TaxID=108980 RepID=A0AA46NRS3_9GAMM|nr:hypothetical protein [Acinetobacter ursingii]UYF73869.1 hypothetical protein LSO60_18815 [Acinetobacter ursingii]
MQLDFGFPVVEDHKQDSNVKYTVDISHLHYFYILVNSCGVLEKSKSKSHAKISDFTAILECDNEQIADEVLNCIKGAKKGKRYRVPKFNTLYFSRSAVNSWKSSVNRRMGFEKSQRFRSVPSKWDYI